MIKKTLLALLGFSSFLNVAYANNVDVEVDGIKIIGLPSTLVAPIASAGVVATPAVVPVASSTAVAPAVVPVASSTAVAPAVVPVASSTTVAPAVVPVASSTAVAPAVVVPVGGIVENELYGCNAFTLQGKEIVQQFELWNAALWTEKSSEVVKLYDRDAILLPTVSNQVRHSHAEIKDYFNHFLQKHPEGKLIECNIRVNGHLASNTGVYRFKLKDKKGNVSYVEARFSFSYKRQLDGSWLIVEHHSSAMPEKEGKSKGH